VEHACHGCGAAVNEGVAFCPHCGAPQIRVQVASDTENESAPTSQPDDLGELGPARTLTASGVTLTQVHWPQAFRCALPAAVLATVVGFIVSLAAGPLPGLLAWTLLSGILATAMYARRMRPIPIVPGIGAKIGALTGLIGFLVVSLLTSAQLLTRGSGEFRALLQEQLRRSSAAADPAVQPWLDYFLSPRGMAVMMMVSLAFTLVLFVGLSSVGGAIWTKLGRRR
jgi:hypothetical protein